MNLTQYFSPEFPSVNGLYLAAFVGLLVVLIAWGTYRYLTRNLISWWHEDEDEDGASLLPVEVSISVVIVCHNEGAELEHSVPRFVKQKGVNFETIVVNAASTDSTSDVLKRLCAQHPQLRQTYVPTSSSNLDIWNFACVLGARAARNEWVIFCRPDTLPATDFWLLDLAQYIDASVRLLVDYGHNTGADRWITSAFRRRQEGRKMARTALSGRAIDTAGGSLLVQRDWFINRASESASGECIYLYRLFSIWDRVILRVQNHHLSDAILW